MLERAAGCFETAGRHFLRESNGAIRTKRSLSHNFWKSTKIGGDAAHWFLALMQPPTRRVSAVPRHTDESKEVNDGSTLFLDFLYPPKTQEFAALRLSRHSKRPRFRQRRKTLASFSRAYTSHASTLRQDDQVETSLHEMGNGATVPQQSIDDLAGLLKSARPDFDKAWVLYIAAGRPQDARSALCRLLSTSRRVIDQDRAWQLFEEIASGKCSAEDYLNITKSQLKSENYSSEQRLKLRSICEQSVSYGSGDACCALTFAHHVKADDWVDALHIWKLRARSTDDPNRPQPQSFLSRLPQSTIPECVIGLGKFIAKYPNDADAASLAQLLLDHVSKSTTLLGNTPMELLLRILRCYNDLGIVTGRHYFNIIESIQSSSVRSVFVRSIVFYRHLRWQMPEEKPPERLLRGQLDLVTSFDLTASILFFLEEFSYFHGKPSIEAYKRALYVFARSGDVQGVNVVFDKLMKDHGKPKSRRLVTPLLHVHARIGDVKGTLKQFYRISDDFHLKPNTACWNILLTAYANTEDFEGTFSTLQNMLQAGAPPDSYTFGILMGACANRGDIQGVRRLLKEAQNYQVQITMPMLDTIVHAYLNNGRLDLAEELAEACLSLKVKGSPMRMWNAILMQHAFRIDAKSFHRVFARIEEAGLAPDAMTYAATMLRMVLTGNPDVARMTLRRLHKRRIIHATEFHYAIVLLGYVKARNRDMVHIIFREMTQRFGALGMHSSLLRLKSTIQRDLDVVKQNDDSYDADLRLEAAEKFLLTAISQFDLSALPGICSSPTFTASHYEYLIREYGARGAIQQATSLFQRYVQDQEKSSTASPIGPECVPTRLLNAMMLAHLKAEQLEQVEQCWQIIFPRAVKMASPISLDPLFTSRPIKTCTPEEQHLAEPSSVSDRAAESDRILSQPPGSPSEHRPQILPSHRFDLSRPLSLYMRALAYQNETGKIFQVVADVEAAGFTLTTFNWSTFVQMLAASDRYSDLTEAFRTFEEKFVPNLISWKRLKSGQGMKPPGVPRSVYLLEDRRKPEQSKRFLGKAARRYWSNIQPDFMQPTYISMVYLAAALNRVREMSIMNGSNELENLYSIAPKTVEVLGRLPYLRDKFQGVLVRHRSEQPEKERKPRRVENPVAPGGILGSGSRLRRRQGIYDDQPLSPADPTAELVEHDITGVHAEDPLEYEDVEANIWGNPLPSEDLVDFEDQMRFHQTMQNRRANRRHARWQRHRNQNAPLARRVWKPENSQDFDHAVSSDREEHTPEDLGTSSDGMHLAGS